MARLIRSIYRIIITVRKHIIPQEPLAGAGVAVGVDKPAQGGVIVAAEEIIPAGLFEEGLPLMAI